MRQSAGILLYRNPSSLLEVFLVHPGGPFWKNKDLGAWSIPKGEFSQDEEPLAAALREFEEETGQQVAGAFYELSPIKQKSASANQCKFFPWCSHNLVKISYSKGNLWRQNSFFSACAPVGNNKCFTAC